METWNGIMPEKLAVLLGMTTDFFRQGNGHNGDDPDDGWFYKPFEHGDHEKLFRDLSRDSAIDSPEDSDDDDDNWPTDESGLWTFLYAA